MKHWFSAARPKTLVAIIAPVIMGGALSRDAFNLGLWLLVLLFGLCIQIGTNLSNDYFDFLKGSDTEKRKGPIRVCQAQLIDPAVVKTAAFGTFALAFLTSLILSLWTGVWVALLGALSVVLGVAYTAGPYALAYLGLGDLFVIIFFGPVALGGTDAILTGRFSPAVWLVGFAPGLLSAALLTVNNIRDIDEDRMSGKKTLAVRFGARFARCEYYLCLAGALFIGGPAVWLLLPLALYLAHRVAYGYDYNKTLGMTGMMLALFTIFFTVGTLWS